MTIILSIPGLRKDKYWGKFYETIYLHCRGKKTIQNKIRKNIDYRLPFFRESRNTRDLSDIFIKRERLLAPFTLTTLLYSSL